MSYGYRPSSSGSQAPYRQSGYSRDPYEIRAPAGSSSLPTPRTYSLQILQQPIAALAAGLDPYAYSRMPIIPAPILRMRAYENGRELRLREFLRDLSSFVCLASLLPASSRSYSQSLDFVSTGGHRLQALIGQLVSDAKPVLDRNGEEAAYFVFDNLSVRVPGDFCIRFRLTQAIPAAPVLAEDYTANFTVYSYDEFDTRIDVANTDLTRHLLAQGLNVFLPPLT